MTQPIPPELLEQLRQRQNAASPAPAPGWYNVPVQADNKTQYVPPPGWYVPGQPPPPPPTGQQPAADNYVPPPGWHVPGQQPPPPLTDAQKNALLALQNIGYRPKGK